MSESALASRCIALPFGFVLLSATDTAVHRLDFLAEEIACPSTANHALLDEAEQQLLAYARNPAHVFDLPLQLEGTAHQQKVWQQIATIGTGQTRRYAEIASAIISSPRAVGGACGRNPVPIIIPCHRVVAAQGLGGFNANRNGLDWMPIKRWLLAHEGVIERAASQ
ncbi:methylated-DNA--[protein]-cysteine S-methyltransferase [Chitinibacter sp. GC72]|uniref:methylated-DNA--[protein]-cysteine S-methyltransferase n=1 Tax=Chitinibacter sp. GC72 TaxID=1526917 RepID=UPI0012F72CE6|nr:methylated-DNA--[protein]-cysteine S-methyltransferase [Chitinibacter sp. GC72]